MYSSGKEKSRVAHMQVEHVVEAWRTQIERQNLVASRVPPNVTKPFELEPEDVAGRKQQQALMWSKVLPFVLFIWALTGAFYPAVDLCAGEKERGTLETLLSSPARRIEIVWGKLLTVMTFSMATAVLNLASLGFTARYVDVAVALVTDCDDWQQFEPAAAIVGLVVARGAAADVGLVQRSLPGVCGVRPQHEGGPVLPDAVAAGEHAADDAADGAGHGIEFGQ